jgi:DNA-binding PadR family transcriptional regulator
MALAVLAMLFEAPMHPYRMQRLIKERGKGEVINVEQRAGLYQTIQRLEREELISAARIIRDDKRPERTVYEITAKGRAMTLEWMRQILSTPSKEYPEFPAAISFLALLPPDDVLRQLGLRATAVETEIGRIRKQVEQATQAQLPRLFLLEMEYLLAVQVTELTWVNAVAEDLRAGRLTWSEAWVRQIAAQFSSISPGSQD